MAKEPKLVVSEDKGGQEGFSIENGVKTDRRFWQDLEDDDSSPHDFDYKVGKDAETD